MRFAVHAPTVLRGVTYGPGDEVDLDPLGLDPLHAERLVAMGLGVLVDDDPVAASPEPVADEPSPPDDDGADVDDEWASMTRAELREIARARGLLTGGTKGMLLERLRTSTSSL